ncbi:hypothetical protein ACPWT1_08540 [Ramlibacter sp. MMS24-I3-19]|uniref:hypothetical protein n=1 Tax=Ramlibacter sp. MMS24-I3-19 TaxID=3416606 RepID=UPI003D040F52
MPRTTRRLRLATLLAALLGTAAAASAIEAGDTPGGQRYLIGGIGQEEVAMIDLARDQFTLFVRTAVRGSGEYLADVRVRITDAEGRVVFDRGLGAPELLIRLAPGHYALQAATAAEVQRSDVTVDAKGVREVVFRFSPAPGS